MWEDRHDGLGHAFLEQKGGSSHYRIRFEAALHRFVQQHIDQRQQAHALMVGHELADVDACRRTVGRQRHIGRRYARRRVINSFVESVLAAVALSRKAFEILAGGLGCHHQGKGTGIRRDNQIFRQTPF